MGLVGSIRVLGIKHFATAGAPLPFCELVLHVTELCSTLAFYVGTYILVPWQIGHIMHG